MMHFNGIAVMMIMNTLATIPAINYFGSRNVKISFALERTTLTSVCWQVHYWQWQPGYMAESMQVTLKEQFDYHL